MFSLFSTALGFAKRISLETSAAKQHEPAFAPCKPRRFLLGSGRLVFNSPRVLSEPPGR